MRKFSTNTLVRSIDTESSSFVPKSVRFPIMRLYRQKFVCSSVYVLLTVGMTALLMLLVGFPLSIKAIGINATMSMAEQARSNQNANGLSRVQTIGSLQQCQRILLKGLGKFIESEDLFVTKQGFSQRSASPLRVVDNFLVTREEVGSTLRDNRWKPYLGVGNDAVTDSEMEALLLKVADFNPKIKNAGARRRVEVNRLKVEMDCKKHQAFIRRQRVELCIRDEQKRRQDAWSTKIARKQAVRQTRTTLHAVSEKLSLPDHLMVQGSDSLAQETELEVTEEIDERQRNLRSLFVSQLPDLPEVVEVEQEIKQLKTRRIGIHRYSIPTEVEGSGVVHEMFKAADGCFTSKIFGVVTTLNVSTVEEVVNTVDPVAEQRTIASSTKVTGMRFTETVALRELTAAAEQFNQMSLASTTPLSIFSIVQSANVSRWIEDSPKLTHFAHLILTTVVIGVGFAVPRVHHDISDTGERMEQLGLITCRPTTGLFSRPDGPMIADRSICCHSHLHRVMSFGERPLRVLFYVVFTAALVQDDFGQQFADKYFAAFNDAVYDTAALVQSYISFV